MPFRIASLTSGSAVPSLLVKVDASLCPRDLVAWHIDELKDVRVARGQGEERLLRFCRHLLVGAAR